MAREINARSRVNRKLGSRNLANQLGGDPRLVPIGRSGRWGIKARDGEGAQSILDIMIEALRRSGTPLARTAIYSAVAAVRPVSENSVAIYLTTQSQFVELDDGTWSLAVWPQAK